MLRTTDAWMPWTDWSGNAARVAFAAALVLVILLAALHLLEPDLDPSWRFISEYELGDYGWLMRIAFLSLSLGCVALGMAVRPRIRTVAGYLGLGLLAISALGMIMAGTFVSDPATASEEARTADGRLHELGAMLDLVPFAAPLINRSLARDHAWSPSRRTLLWTAWLPLIGTLGFVASLALMLPSHGGRPGPEVLVGWPNRIMILAHCAGLMPVAWCAVRLSGRGRPDRHAEATDGTMDPQHAKGAVR